MSPDPTRGSPVRCPTRPSPSWIPGATLLFCACAHGPRIPRSSSPMRPPTAQVVLTVPVETVLDVPDVPDTRTVWIDMLRSARSRVDIEQFYVSEQPGSALTPVLDALREAAARGVLVRLL